MTERNAVIGAVAARYQRATKADKQVILDDLCATTGWHRDHARKALRCAGQSRTVVPDRLHSPKYGSEVIGALTFCWMLLGMPAGKRLAPILGELVSVLRRFGELQIDDATASLLTEMSAATIDRRLASQRRGRSHAVAGPRFKSRFPSRVCGESGNAAPGFVEVRLVPHDGGNRAGAHGWTLTVTDIATGWTEKRSVCDKTQSCVPGALDDIAITMPFPILGVDNDDGRGFDEGPSIWCASRQIAATGPRSGIEHGHCHGEVIRNLVGYRRYNTDTEIRLLNRIWKLQSLLTNYFYPHQRLVSKVRTRSTVSKKYDTAATPHRRAEAHPSVSAEDKAILADTYAAINPAAVHRRIQALTSELLMVTAGTAEPKQAAARWAS